MSDDRLERALHALTTDCDCQYCESIRNPIRALFAERWTTDEVREIYHRACEINANRVTFDAMPPIDEAISEFKKARATR